MHFKEWTYRVVITDWFCEKTTKTFSIYYFKLLIPRAWTTVTKLLTQICVVQRLLCMKSPNDSLPNHAMTDPTAHNENAQTQTRKGFKIPSRIIQTDQKDKKIFFLRANWVHPERERHCHRNFVLTASFCFLSNDNSVEQRLFSVENSTKCHYFVVGRNNSQWIIYCWIKTVIS